MSDRITLAELAKGLAEYRNLFNRLDVFADDIAELHDDAALTTTVLQKVSSEPDAYLFEHDGEKYVLRVTKDGVARISFADATTFAVGALLGSAFGAAVGAATSKKGGGWATGLVLGMFAGTAVGAVATASRPKRVLTVRFDPSTRSWAAYDGGLVTWLKSEFVESTA